MKHSIGTQLKIKIDRLSFGHGHGVGRTEDGLVVFVPSSAPGDYLSIEITKSKKNFAEARILEILEPGENRVSPDCQYAESCGGCQWQHVSYSEQVKQKEAILKQTFERAGLDSGSVNKFHAAPKPTRYRNRIQLHFDEQSFGYRSKSSHDLVAIEDCLISDKKLIDKARRLHSSGVTGRIEIFLDQDEAAQKINATEQRESSFFSQVNNDVNQLLLKSVLELSEKMDPNLIFDLYGGQGNFAIPLAQRFKRARVFSVDSLEKNVDLGLKAANSKGIMNLEFVNKMTHQFLKKSIKRTHPDLIILDPPRAGLDKQTIDYLLKLQSSRILYVSCDPSTLVRDLSKLCKSGWNLETATGFDMFPQTFHMETLSYLTPRP